MERLDLLPREGNLYKANLHCHTTCSDGRLTPQQVKEKFKAHGYSVIAFTDHNVIVDHSDLNDEGFLALTGVEVDTDSFIYGPKHAFNQTCHLCLIARDPQRVEPVERSVFYTGKAIKSTNITGAATSSTTTIPPGPAKARTSFWATLAATAWKSTTTARKWPPATA